MYERVRSMKKSDGNVCSCGDKGRDRGELFYVLWMFFPFRSALGKGNRKRGFFWFFSGMKGERGREWKDEGEEEVKKGKRSKKMIYIWLMVQKSGLALSKNVDGHWTGLCRVKIYEITTTCIRQRASQTPRGREGPQR